MDRFSQWGGILSGLQGSLYKGLSLGRKDRRMILLESQVLGILQQACFLGSWGWKASCLPPAFIQAVRCQQVLLVDSPELLRSRPLMSGEGQWEAVDLQWSSSQRSSWSRSHPFMLSSLLAYTRPQTQLYLKTSLSMRKGLTRPQ